ncbi:MAG: XdhC/CoxI family protein [bacterium]
MDNLDNMPELALEWFRAGRGAVLATVVETWSMAPRAAGSQMVVDGAGMALGSVSGGCIEAAVVLEAGEALQTGRAKLVSYAVSDSEAMAAGLACGGAIKVLVEPVVWDGQLADLVEARAAGLAVALVTGLESFEQRLVVPGQDAAVDLRLRSDRSGVEDGRFIAVHNPPLRLIVVGAVHIAQAMMSMARICGYAPVLIDPRTAFGAATRFPGEAIVEEWPDVALAALAPDARTAVVTLTHDAALDDPAIGYALRSPAFYVGSLGSKGTHAKRVARFLAQGFSEAEIARIRAPVGLDIGAKTPAEIALSVMAEITDVLRKS